MNVRSKSDSEVPLSYPNFMSIRLGAAASVLFSHAFLIGEGTEKNEPLVRLLGPHNILGIYGVFVFFLASGFLITQSAFRSRSVLSYAWKRILRIYPALALCALLCAALLGPFFSQLPLDEYCARLIPLKYVVKTVLEPGAGWQVATVEFYRDPVNHLGNGMNGSLWTIPQELNCYVLIGLLFMAGLLRWWMVALLAAASLPLMMLTLPPSFAWAQNFIFVAPAFLFGALLFFVERVHKLHGGVALISIACAIVAAFFGKFMDLFPLFGAYPVLWLATTERVRLPSLKRVGDISYGVYLYGWPVEQTIRALAGRAVAPLLLFSLSLPVAALFGYLSWNLLEKHALKLKRPPPVLMSAKSSYDPKSPSNVIRKAFWNES